MARLKNRNNGVPGGFRFRQPQINPKWELPISARQDFRMAVDTVYRLRASNEAASNQYGLSLDKNVIADEVDAYTAEGLARQGTKFAHFLAPAPAPAFFDIPKTWPSQQRIQNVAAAVGGVKRTAAGIKLVMDWLGSGLKPVDKALAESRATNCAMRKNGKPCPKNGDPNWLQRVDAMIANQIKSLVEVKNDLKLATSRDAQLQTCTSCDCFLKLKVWTPLNHILDNTTEEVKKKLDPDCWVLHEGEPPASH